MYILVDWCGSTGVLSNIIGMVQNIVNIMRFVVPIALTVMTFIDVFKKVINPDEKEGQKKIISRIIAAVLVFFVPTILRFILILVDVANGDSYGTASSNVANCGWK